VAYHDILDLSLGGWDNDEAEKIGKHLTFIGDVDLSEPCWSFDLLRFYVRPADGAVLYGTDSGCSCPSPFEIFRVGDLKETTLKRVEDVAREYGSESEGGWGYSKAAILKDVRALLPKMKEAGAK
jgi:hypothetical protein